MPPFDYSTLMDDEVEPVFDSFVAVAPERVSALRREVGEEVLDFSPERGDVTALFLVAGGEIDVGVTADGSGQGFRDVLELVLAAAERLDARVLDPQVGGEISRANLQDAVRAFG